MKSTGHDGRVAALVTSDAMLTVNSILAGCAAGPDDRSASIESPARWSGEEDESPQRRLDDASLEQSIDEAAQGNLGDAAANARIRAARAVQRRTIGVLLPSVEGVGAVDRSRTGAIDSALQAGFDSISELDLFRVNWRVSHDIESRAHKASLHRLGVVLGVIRRRPRPSGRWLPAQTLPSRVYVAGLRRAGKSARGGWDGAIDASRPEFVDDGAGPHLPGAF